MALGVLVVGAVLVLGYQAMQARSALQQAEAQATKLRGLVSEGDVDAARLALADLQDSTAEARNNTDGVLWSVAGSVPFVGRNTDAVRTVSRALQSISVKGLAPLVDIADQVNAETFSPKNGRVDLESIRKVSPGLEASRASLEDSGRDLDQIDADSLIGALRGPVADLQEQVGDARSAVSAGDKAARLIPAMMGGSGRRSYILTFQNNAEIRSTGGLPGSFAVLTARDGRLTLSRQGEASDIPYFEKPPVKPTAEELRLYSGLLTGYFGDSNFTPDFPRTAEIMRAMLREDRDQESDGVVSVDPIALSYILGATGPVKLADGTTLTSDNAVKHLLNDVYLDLPNSAEARNRYFADATRRVFQAVTSGAAGGRSSSRGWRKAWRRTAY